MDQPLISESKPVGGRKIRTAIGALVGGLAICGIAGAAVYSTSSVPPSHQMMVETAIQSYANVEVGDGPSWKPCSGSASNTGLTITNIQMNPYPIKRGAPFSIITSGKADSAHPNVSAKVTVKVAGVSVYSKTLPIKGGIEAGDFSNDSSKNGDDQTIPKIAPAGTYGVVLEIIDDDKNDSPLGCVDINFKVA